MTRRTLRILCWTTSIACSAGAVLVILLAVRWPLTIGSIGDAAASSVAAKIVKPSDRTMSMEQFEPLMTGRLHTAPASTQPTPPTPLPVDTLTTTVSISETPGIKLLGTVVEEGNSYAVFETTDGVEVRKQGDSISGAQIQEISDGAAILKQQGEIITLKIPVPAGG